MNKRLLNNVFLNVTHVKSCWKTLQIYKGKENICYDTMAGLSPKSQLNQRKIEGDRRTMSRIIY